MPSKIPESKLKEEIQRLKDEYGKVSVTVMRENGRYSPRTYSQRYGTWNEAIEELGFELTQRKKIPKQELLDDLAELAEELGDPPTGREVDEHTTHSPATYRNRFGSWDDVLRAAGLMPYRVEVECSECGGSLTRQRNIVELYDHYFCSDKCQNEWWSRNFSGENSPRWKGGGPWTYGSNWSKKRREALERDNYTCQGCGKKADECIEEFGKRLSVHHITPIREFEMVEKANTLDNLVSLCHQCHPRWEGIPVRPTFQTSKSD